MSGRELDHPVPGDLPRAELVAAWTKLYGKAPPKGISIRLLAGAIAYARQAKQHGGLSSRAPRRLAKLAGGAPVAEVAAPRTLKPGARLVREWNGVSHTVEVVADGYVWKGERYRSLSAVARGITGARWSGPRFFGLGS